MKTLLFLPALALGLLLPVVAQARPLPELALAPAPVSASTENLRLTPPLRLAAMEFGAGMVAAAASVSGSLLLGSSLGTLSTNTVLAVLPSMLLFLALPPLAVTAAAWLAGNSSDGFRVRMTPALWVAFGVHALATTGAVLAGVSAVHLQGAALFTLVEMLLLPAAVTGTMHWFGTEPRAQSSLPAPSPAFATRVEPAGRPAWQPLAPTLLIPLVSTSF